MKAHSSDQIISLLLETVLTSPAETDTSLRENIFTNKDIPAPLAEFVSKVRNESYRITDTDIKNLITEGYSEDEIFEITITAALASAKQILDAGMNALEEDEGAS